MLKERIIIDYVRFIKHIEINKKVKKKKEIEQKIKKSFHFKKKNNNKLLNIY